MLRGVSISSAGVKFGYAIEETAGTMPKTALFIPDIKTVPDLNQQPEMLDTTDLSCTGIKTFTPGLRDLSGACAYKANFTTLLKKKWEAMVDASEEAEKIGKATWFFISLSSGDTAAYTGKPTALGVPTLEAGSLVEIDCYITPTGEPKWIEETITFTEKADQ